MLSANQNICAIATGQGGAIGIIRLSGPEVIEIADSVFHAIGTPKSLCQSHSYRMRYGQIKDEKGNLIDEVLAAVFRAPHSYTGENAVELSCHASPFILQEIMQLLMRRGCRMAEPGEFSQRAFLNGKMDLAQAEAVADVIASTTRAAHHAAMSQLKGAFSRQLGQLREQLLRLTSLLELEIDFSDHEELEFANRDQLILLTEEIERVIRKLVESFRTGNAVRRGIPVAIVGETNTGKSTLLNQLVGDERAIVSNIHGTTRDVIEDVVTLNGVAFRFIDTAGIRKTEDVIETIGIERSFEKLKQADIVLLMIDAVNADVQYQHIAPQILPLCEDKQLIIVYNKCDLLQTHQLPVHCAEEGPSSSRSNSVIEISLSAKSGEGIEQLKQLIVEAAHLPALTSSDVIVTNVRHHEALTSALAAIIRVHDGLSQQLTSDLLALDLRECLHHLSEILGSEITTDTVLSNIFSKFCIGK